MSALDQLKEKASKRKENLRMQKNGKRKGNKTAKGLKGSFRATRAIYVKMLAS
jgi:hypothetical protein